MSGPSADTAGASCSFRWRRRTSLIEAVARPSRTAIDAGRCARRRSAPGGSPTPPAPGRPPTRAPDATAASRRTRIPRSPSHGRRRSRSGAPRLRRANAPRSPRRKCGRPETGATSRPRSASPPPALPAHEAPPPTLRRPVASVALGPRADAHGSGRRSTRQPPHRASYTPSEIGSTASVGVDIRDHHRTSENRSEEIRKRQGIDGTLGAVHADDARAALGGVVDQRSLHHTPLSFGHRPCRSKKRRASSSVSRARSLRLRIGKAVEHQTGHACAHEFRGFDHAVCATAEREQHGAGEHGHSGQFIFPIQRFSLFGLQEPSGWRTARVWRS